MNARRRLAQVWRRVIPRPRTAWHWSAAAPLLGFLAWYGFLVWRLAAPGSVAVYRWFLLTAGLAAIVFHWGRGIGGLTPAARRSAGVRAPAAGDWAVLMGRSALWTLLLTFDFLLARLGLPLRQMVFTQPWSFAWISLSLWVWWMAIQGWSGLSRRRLAQALIVRLLLVGTFALVLAEPRAVRTSDTISVVYALDMSASIHPEQLSQAQNFIARTVSEKPTGDQAGLVVFGGSAAVELPPDASFPIDENAPQGTIHFNARIDRDATNLEQALLLGAAILPEEHRGRIVLISDGAETVGDLKSVLDQLRAREIAVDVLPVTYNYENEVWIERLELPQSVKLGEPYAASVIVSALQPGKAQLILSENGRPIRDQPLEIEFREGKNRIEIPIYLQRPGYYEYTATLVPEPGTDGREENNRGIGYIYVEGEGKVLIVTDPLTADRRDYDRLRQAILEGERAVEVVNATQFPSDPLSLLPYDCIIFANVPQDAFIGPQLNAVRDAVFNQGTGFLMVGGQNSFGPGGYHRSVVEEILPVSMDITKKKVLPKGALAIILHTCEFAEGNSWAKRITKQAIKVLGSEDEVGVIAYGGIEGEYWIFEMTPAAQYELMAPKINAAAISDMPAFGPTMQMGLDALKKNDAATKHMIIISDGDPAAPPPDMLASFRQSQISISTISIFPHGGQEISLMSDIANVTGGRYYFPADPNELPSIFIKEAKTLKRNMIQEREIQPQAGYPSPIIKGIEAVPPLHGFVLASLKENALTENVLYAIDEESGEEETDPVLAVWRYGLGTTAAFTSSLSNQWARDWVNWEEYRAFVKQLLTRVSRVQRTGDLRMWSYHSGGEGVILVEDFQPQEMLLDVAARVSGPGGLEKIVPLKQVGPRRYQGTFPANDQGRYQVTAVGKGGEREDRVMGGFIVAYSPEFLKFTSNWENLRQIKSVTGGEELSADSPANVLFNRRLPKQSSKPVFDWFLIALACLVPLDVAIRRVQLDWATLKDWLGLGRRAQTRQTMGALLARKERVGSQLEGRPADRPFQPTGIPPSYQTKPPLAPRAAPPPAQQAAPVPPTAAEEESTMGRLLRAKRERDQRDQPE